MRRLFLLVSAYLIVQGLVITVVEEPYPSFRLPDFRGSPDHGGYVQTDTPVLSATFVDGSVQLEDSTVFAGADLPLALVAVVFPESPAPPRTGGALGKALRRYADSFGVFKGARYAAPQTARWLRGRLRELFPGRTPVSFSVRWQRDRFTLDGRRIASRSLNTVTVSLAG